METLRIALIAHQLAPTYDFMCVVKYHQSSIFFFLLSLRSCVYHVKCKNYQFLKRKFKSRNITIISAHDVCHREQQGQNHKEFLLHERQLSMLEIIVNFLRFSNSPENPDFSATL